MTRTLAAAALSLATLAPAQAEMPAWLSRLAPTPPTKAETLAPSVRGMFCNSPCAGVTFAPDRHMGELATLVIYRQQCFQGPPRYVGDTGQIPQFLAYRFEPVWQEWNNAPMEAKKAALTHEIAAINARGLAWFCNIMTDHINKDDYRDLERPRH
jgi:hypothetical protein